MAAHNSSNTLLKLSRCFSKLALRDASVESLAPRLCRTMATETSLPTASISELTSEVSLSSTLIDTVQHTSFQDVAPNAASNSKSQVITTVYSWPDLEPLRFARYHSKHLQLPLRRDILHRAVIYEADGSRQGTASTKWRDAVRGSGRKILPQKGTGHARAGDKKSPIRRGGGVAFGPHPRDFSTDLPRKVYDLAWRTALSYRYRRGELIIIGDKISIPRHTGGRLLSNIFEGNEWGKGNKRSLLVTPNIRERLYAGMEEVGEHGLVKDIQDVDVKDLLETGRIIIEKEALDILLFAHGSDLGVRADIDFATRASRLPFLLHANEHR